MLFKKNNSSDINEDQIALIEYAQNRICLLYTSDAADE